MNIDLNKFDNISLYKKHNLCFFGITKCCSTSIKAALLKQSIINKYALRYDYIYNHKDAMYISKNNNFNDYITFTVIRHPYIRIASLYKHFIIRDPKRLFELSSSIKAVNARDITYFLEYLFGTTNDYTCNHHFKSISSFTVDTYNVIIPKLVFDFDKDNNSLKTFLKSFECSIEKSNVSNTDLFFTKKHKQLIQNRYESDFNNFNFEE